MVRPVIGALALVLAVAACGGDPKADPSPTPSTPVTTPVSTTPAPPVLPEAAKANTKAGAVAFVRYYVAVQNYASNNGDTDDLRSAAAPTCESCTTIADLIDKVYRSGGHIEGKGWTVLTASPAGIAEGQTNLVYVDVALRIDAQAIFASPSASPSRYTGNPRRLMTFGLSHAEAGWQVSRIVASTS
jgi:hypothetical protein